jgi:hypothetical protein
LPVSGWRGPSEPVAFRILFHSLFHGYLVIEYRATVPQSTLAMLRSWARAHARGRVVAVPAVDSGPTAVEAATWGYGVRCESATALTESTLDRLLSLGAAG